MNKIHAVPVVIPSGAAVPTAWIKMATYNDQGGIALTGIAMPAAVDAVTLVVEFSLDGSTALPVAGATITHTASTYFPLNPAEYACVPGYFRLKLGGNAAASRTYQVVMRDV